MCNKNQPPNNKKHRGFLEQTRSWICLVGEFFTFYHSQAPFCSTIWEEYVWFTFSKQRIEVANSILQVDNSLAPCCPKVPMRRGERQEHRIIHLMCVHIWYIEVQIWYIHMHVNMLHIWCIHILFRTWPAVYIYIYICVLWYKHWIHSVFQQNISDVNMMFFVFEICVVFFGWKQSPNIWAMLKNPIVVQGISGIYGLHLEHVRSHGGGAAMESIGARWMAFLAGSHEKGDSRQSQV